MCQEGRALTIVHPLEMPSESGMSLEASDPPRGKMASKQQRRFVNLCALQPHR